MIISRFLWQLRQHGALVSCRGIWNEAIQCD